jgi:para-nitrobenzyl esterase
MRLRAVADDDATFAGMRHFSPVFFAVGPVRKLLAPLTVALIACGSSSAKSPAAAGSRDAGSRDTGRPTHDGGKGDASYHDADASLDASHRADASHDAASDAPLDAGPCPVTNPSQGPLVGLASGAVCAYEGVPYAAPPTGDLRWKPPAPPASWTTPRPSAFASGCPQGSSDFGVASSDEDCLYLNVWTPSVHPVKPLAVMVFVHGGSFVWGSGSFPLYDATNLASATGNVVVTINYRLGALGFLSLPELRAEDPSVPTSGNYGILDQIAAFTWVKANIAAFGGDPSNVTVFGESAGGTSMLIHLASPKSTGLFDHVLIESAYAPNGAGAGPEASADSIGAMFASAVGCTGPSVLSCLRTVSLGTILNESESSILGEDLAFTWFPIVDGYVLPDYPVRRIVAGTFNKVPTLLGTNKNEGTLFVATSPPTDEASFVSTADVSFPGNGMAIAAEYPVAGDAGAADAGTLDGGLATFPTYEAAAAEALTDGAFVCPARQVARALTAAGLATYRYDFVHAIDFPVPNLGAFHGSELEFVFGNVIDSLAAPLTPAEETLSSAMMGYWGAMAATGEPNGGGRLTWPVYELGTEPDLVLDLTLSTETQLKKAQCDFWDALPTTP